MYFITVTRDLGNMNIKQLIISDLSNKCTTFALFTSCENFPHHVLSISLVNMCSANFLHVIRLVFRILHRIFRIHFLRWSTIHWITIWHATKKHHVRWLSHFPKYWNESKWNCTANVCVWITRFNICVEKDVPATCPPHNSIEFWWTKVANHSKSLTNQFLCSYANIVKSVHGLR